jgi:predicted PurR-regulated permease PerM
LILGPVLLGVLLAVMRIYNLETEKYRKSWYEYKIYDKNNSKFSERRNYV